MQDNEENVIVVEEDNIVSEEESFVENEEEEDMINISDAQEEPNAEEVIVASAHDHEPEKSGAQSRLRKC